VAVGAVTYERRIPSNKLNLKLAPGSQANLKIVWSVNALLAQYEISEEFFNTQASRVRDVLDRLVKAKIKGEPIGPILKDLARAGKVLYGLLFKANDYENEPPKAQKWMAAAEQPLFINITVSTYTRIPWGLLYEGDPELIPDDADPMDFRIYEGFWCLKYLIACLHQRIKDVTEMRPEFKVFPVIHKNEYTKVHAALTPAEQTRIADLLMSFGGGIETSQDLYAKWKRAGAIDRILMFYCHANGASLSLSEKDSVSTTDFGTYLDYASDWPDSVTITFLNGCSTAVGLATKGFLEATGQRGFMGFVGTEAKVPNVYALRFGAEFLQCFLSTGWPLVIVMDAMWRLHWPLSLLYGLNGYSDLKLKRPEAVKRWPASPYENFSENLVGMSSI
jgi:hypothetical protein